jgi:hypothetical protein
MAGSLATASWPSPSRRYGLLLWFCLLAANPAPRA